MTQRSTLPSTVRAITVIVDRADGSTLVYDLNPRSDAVDIRTDVGFRDDRSPDGFHRSDDDNDPFGWPSDNYQPTHIRYACIFPLGEVTAMTVERRWADDAAVARIAELEARLATVVDILTP